MTENLSLLLHLFYIFSVSILTLSLTGWLLSRLFFNWVQQFNIKSRIFLLRSFGAMPIVGAMIICTMVSIPALNHSSILPLDHCHSSIDCVGETATHMVTVSEFAVICLMLMVFLNALFYAIKQWWRANNMLNSIAFVSRKIDGSNIHLMETTTPLAFSVGMLKPKSVLSTGLMTQLTSKQLKIVCNHEEIHTQHRDSLFKWALKLVSLFHLPKVKRTLLNEHASALEFRADQEVSNTVNSNIAVAETIIKVQRIMGSSVEKESICQFLGSALEQRIQFLLSTSPDRPLTNKTIAWFTVTLIIFASLGAAPLHNAVEMFLSR